MTDTTEIDKFNALSGSWWDESGPFRALHAMNPVRLGALRKRISPKGLKCLDIGCGGGLFAEALAKEGGVVTAIDLAENAIEAAKAHAASSRHDIDYRLVSSGTLADSEPASFDIVSCLELLEHVDDYAQIVSHAARLAKPGGVVYFSTINRTPQAYLYAIAGAEYVAGLLPVGTHSYCRFIRPAELARAARDAGLTVETVTGITSDITASSFKLTDKVSVNYLMICSKP